MYIATVSVSSAYLAGCDDGNIPENKRFVVRRSREWDLANPQERFEAALAFLRCLNYLMSDVEERGKVRKYDSQMDFYIRNTARYTKISVGKYWDSRTAPTNCQHWVSQGNSWG
jgi:hypothetical protein